MPTLFDAPRVIQAASNKPKQIEEFVGRVSSGDEKVSVARMVSPAGWEEAVQQPEFDEISFVLCGMLRLESDGGVVEVQANQAVIARAGESVRYSTPAEGGAEYIAICIPAFSPQSVHRLNDER